MSRSHVEEERDIEAGVCPVSEQEAHPAGELSEHGTRPDVDVPRVSTRPGPTHQQQGEIFEDGHVKQPSRSNSDNGIFESVELNSSDETDESRTQDSHQSQKNVKSRPSKKTKPPECRICLSNEDSGSFVQPCSCTGSLKYAHLDCLKSWVQERQRLTCEICNSEYKEPLLPELKPEIRETAVRPPGATSFFPSMGAHLVFPPLVDTIPQRPPGWNRRRIMVRMALILGGVGTLVGILVVLGINASTHTWAAILLRIIAFGLPALIVLKAFATCCEFRIGAR